MKVASEHKIFTAVSRDGTQLGCVVEGEGPPLLMIHGTGDTHQGWRRMRPFLVPYFKLYLMDRRGRGVSGDRDDYALEREWEDVASIVDSIPEPVNVFAHSFGAMCALEAGRVAANCRRLCVYEPSVNRNSGNTRREFAIDEMSRLIASGDRDGVVTIHLRNIINASEETIGKQRAQEGAWAARKAMAHTMPRELQALRSYKFDARRFSGIEAPLRVLLGEKSAGHGPETARSLVEAVRGSELTRLEGQGHFAMLTAPDLLARSLIDFFR